MAAKQSWADRWEAGISGARELRTVVRRGRVIASRGRVGNLVVRPGLITSEVKDDAGSTYSVKMRMDQFSDDVWDDALEEMAREAAYSAAILGGQLTDDMLAVFSDVGGEVLPADHRDVSHFCTCAEFRTPVCSHAMATHFALAKAAMVDPFIFLKFRGRTRDELTAGLKTLRAQQLGGGPVEGEVVEEVTEEVLATEPIAALMEGYFKRGIIPHLAFHFALEGDGNGDEEGFPVVRALGPAPGDTLPDAVADVLAPLGRMAQRRTHQIVEQVQDDVPAPTSNPNQASTLDEMLVAAAHQHGELTTGFVSEALGISPYEARQYLAWLVEEGRLTKTGRSRGTKYLPV